MCGLPATIGALATGLYPVAIVLGIASYLAFRHGSEMDALYSMDLANESQRREEGRKREADQTPDDEE